MFYALIKHGYFAQSEREQINIYRYLKKGFTSLTILKSDT